MISNDCEIIDSELTEMKPKLETSQRQIITARRRSLSGSAVVAKSDQRILAFDLTTNVKHKFKIINQKIKLKNGDISYDSTDCIHSDVENVRDSSDLHSLSNERSSPAKYHKSNSLLFTNSHRSSVSTKTIIKHFLAEHIVKIHPCNHPEYHVHKKNSDIGIENENMKNADFQESEFPDQISITSSNSSSSKEINNPRPKSAHDHHIFSNYTNMASTVLDRIRHMNIQPINPIQKICSEFSSSNNNDLHHNEPNIFFPCPEPNPCKLPKVTSPSSIMFSSKLIASNKSKRHRLAHSVSLDPGYRLSDTCKDPDLKRHFQFGSTFCPEFSPEKDKWEKHISGYLDTSTPTGAALTAINFGLKRVTETDKYLMITKSPISSPNEFLKEGINHLQDPRTMYRSLLQHTNSYDLMPDSGKVIIIDSQMQINKAFEALEENVVRASPIWNSEKQEFVALLTVNDFIPLLLHIHQLQRGEDHCCEDENLQFENFSAVTVEKSLSVIPRFRTLQGHIAGVSPETNLYSITNMLNQIKRSQVIVLDVLWSGNPLFLLTDLRILTYMALKMRSMNTESCFLSPILSESILSEHKLEILKPLCHEESPCEDLCISTQSKTQYLVYNDSPMIDVLRAMARSYHTCALILAEEQIIDDQMGSQFVINNVITISDILHLVIINKHKDPNLTANEIIKCRDLLHFSMTFRDPVTSCSINDSLQHLIDTVVKERASFALIRTNNNISSPTVAVLSSIDILNYICKQPTHYTSLPCHSSIISDFNKVKKPVLKYSLDRIRQNSDGCTFKISSKLLDDTLEEVFNIEMA